MSKECSILLTLTGCETELWTFGYDHNLHFNFCNLYGNPLYKNREQRIFELSKRHNDYKNFEYGGLSIPEDEKNKKNDILDFGVILPRPDKSHWITWNKYWWGSLSNAYNTKIYQMSSDKIVISFNTFNTIPLRWVRELSNYYKKLNVLIQYYSIEYGYYQYKNGLAIKYATFNLKDFLRMETSLSKTLNQIKSLPFKYNLKIEDFISLFKDISLYLREEELDYVFFPKLDYLPYFDIYSEINSIWKNYTTNLPDLMKNLKYNFYLFVPEILKYYTNIIKINKNVRIWRLKHNIKKWRNMNLLKNQIINFGYTPEYSEYPGTIYSMGGYLYREGKERFYNNINFN